MIFQSGNWDEPWMFLTFIKKRDNGPWEKLAEGKTIKLSLLEIVALRDVVAGNRPEWKTFHKGNGTGTPISARLESGKESTTVLISAGDYLRPINYPETVILQALLDHMFAEKITNATGGKQLSEESPQEAFDGETKREPISELHVPAVTEKKAPVQPSPTVTDVDLSLAQSFAALNFPPLPQRLPNGAYPITGHLKSVKKENGITTLYLQLASGNFGEAPATTIVGAGLHGTEVDLVIKGPGTSPAIPPPKIKANTKQGRAVKTPEIAPGDPATGKSISTPTEPGAIRAASVRAVTKKALLVINASCRELWVPKKALADAVPAPAVPQDVAWQFAVKDWFAEKLDFQNWVKSS